MKRFVALAVLALTLVTCRDATEPQLPPTAPLFSATSASAPTTWTNTPNLNVPRYLAGAAGSVLNGRIYVSGGASDAGFFGITLTAALEAFDPVTGIWTQLAPLPAPRYGHGFVSNQDGSKFYAIGGAVVGGTLGTNSVLLYDLSSNTWTAKASLPAPWTSGAATAGPDGRIYVSGGYFPSGLTNTALVYDPVSDVWTSIADMPGGVRAYHAMATGPDGRIYAIGGVGAAGPPMTLVEAYSPLSNTWSTVASLPAARSILAATRGADGRIYVLAGSEGSLSIPNTVFAYNVPANSWSTAPSLNSSRYGLSGATGADGRIYAIGGINSAFGSPSNTAEWYPTTPSVIATTTTLTSSSNPSVSGQTVQFTAAVTGGSSHTPTGTVTVSNGAFTLGTASLGAAGDATIELNLFAGEHAITARYAGDANFGPSTSPGLTQTVNPASTITTLTSSANPSLFGQAIQLSATVSVVAPGRGTPTDGEQVTFSEGETLLGTADLAAGTASITVSSFAVGLHSITASYGGDRDFSASTSDNFAQTVNPGGTITTLVSSTDPSVFGQAVQFTAMVTGSDGGTPSGLVSFADGGTTLGMAALGGGGTATLSTSSLTVGSHVITAVYAGDSNFGPSTSFGLTQTVNLASTTTTLTSSLNPSTFGQEIGFTATVSGVGGTPTGAVTFTESGITLGTVTLAGGTASITMSTLSVGLHAIAATYEGDGNFSGSTGSLTQTVTSASTTTTLTSSLNPSTFGREIAFTATVAGAGGTPTGTVSFTEGGTALGTVTLAGGTASITISTLSVGSHAVTATYEGDGSFSGSTGSLNQTVNLPPNSAPVAVAGSPYAGSEGLGLAFSAAGSFDPDGDPLTYDWDFGDGTVAPNCGPTPSHTYADNGTYTATVTVHDDHGHSSSASASVTVANVAPTVSAIAGARILPGETYSASGSFSDPGADTHSAAVNWGTGPTAALALNGGAFNLSRQYTTAGTFMVTVTVTDDDGGMGTSSATVTVLSAADGAQELDQRVTQLAADGAIRPQAARALGAALNVVERALARGNQRAARAALLAFIIEVRLGDRLNTITPATATELIGYAQRLLRSI